MKEPAQITGYIVVIVSALAFAGNNVFAVLSYEGGTTPLTLITFRMALTLVALAVMMKLMDIAIPLPKKERNAAFILGLLNGIMAFCLMSAFDHIDVGLAILVFYLYPVLTGLGAWMSRQETLNRGIIIGLIGSFGGLALALDVTGETGNLQGIALAGGAAVLMTIVILLSARVLQTDNARSVTLHMHVSASSLFIVISLIAGELSLPGTTGGWVGFIGVPLFYAVAVATFFAGIAMIGGVRTSLVMNLEPVASIALGFILLGQILSPRQLLGAAIVIAAVTAVKWLSGAKKDA